MRLAYVINSVEGGGAASPVPAVAGTLAALGAEVRVLALTGRDGRALPAMEAAGVDVRVRRGGERDHLAALAWLDGEVAAWRAEAVWTSLTRATLLGQIVGARRRLPVASWQHNAFLKPANLLLLRARRRASALWVADSTHVASLTRERLGVTAERIVTWPLFRADPGVPRTAAWRPGQPVGIGSLGRLHPAKGYDVLIDALALLRRRGTPLPQMEVTLAGEGAERSALQRRIADAGITGVALPGFAADPASFLAGLHLYVQPSRREGLCIAAHEAMAAGLPVLASAVGELPASIGSEAGVIVPPEDATTLADALQRLLARPERLAGMGEAARREVLRRFSADRFGEAGAEAYHRLAAAR